MQKLTLRSRLRRRANELIASVNFSWSLKFAGWDASSRMFAYCFGSGSLPLMVSNIFSEALGLGLVQRHDECAVEQDKIKPA